ncbi:DUF1990 family protein [Actinoplanes derwentensis]|uniref:Uncharacterized protein, UPF0548 family n=1 Tax=Actinoplanes derwentensis TaxID=113562 RepID=A0A1H2D8L6_9ACTN|nr:DUF1990 domain-containing protein [Actinoplanes derwentensis]GID86241.1 DUF1990 domain-containing protein [Actinoplanes derwentensis]SDT78802.1 Uncharacterized protein, UPF0548 family [Actinoplanes derwentensis]
MTDLTYPHVGSTRTGRLPAGYRHLRYRTRLGTGEDVLARAGEAVLSFRMHRATGTRITADAHRAAPGVLLTVGLGPLRAPCEVVWTLEEGDRIGFAYGTRPGHPATGEEAFVVERDEHDRVWLVVTAFSRPAGPLMRVAGPFAVGFQHMFARLCGFALRRLGTVKR